ncbi:alpha/beta hydrolase [Streptomyces sp. NPDC058612]|uniref:alpha/beta hydrolase n=1 Tax=Streptomyces sp. NPDC058612 TaxID=3346555 RepID=UPI003665950F
MLHDQYVDRQTVQGRERSAAHRPAPPSSQGASTAQENLVPMGEAAVLSVWTEAENELRPVPGVPLANEVEHAEELALDPDQPHDFAGLDSANRRELEAGRRRTAPGGPSLAAPGISGQGAEEAVSSLTDICQDGEFDPFEHPSRMVETTLAPAPRDLRKTNGEHLSRALARVADLPCHVLIYDPEFEGVGRVVAALGDVETATHVCVLVPGMGSSPADFEELILRARTVHDECRRVDPGARVAIIAWQGYKAPRDIRQGKGEVSDDTPAKEGSKLLNIDLAHWRALWRSSASRRSAGLPELPQITVNGFSYGSVVAGYALMRRTEAGGVTDTAKGFYAGMNREIVHQTIKLFPITAGVKKHMQGSDLTEAVLEGVNRTLPIVKMAADFSGTEAAAYLVAPLKATIMRSVDEARAAYKSEPLGGGQADFLVLFGSPGTGRRAQHLNISPTRIFVAAHKGDLVSELNYFSIDPAHYRYDPTGMVTRLRSTHTKTPADSWTDAHMSYYEPASTAQPRLEALTNLARVITGNRHRVTSYKKRSGLIRQGHKFPAARLFTNPPTNTAVPTHGPAAPERSAAAAEYDGNIAHAAVGQTADISVAEQRTGLPGGHRSVAGRVFNAPPKKSRKKRETGDSNTFESVPEPVVVEHQGGDKEHRADAVKRPITGSSALPAPSAPAAPKPPTVLYRVDVRPPGDVFGNGFSAYGADLDLEKHARGTTTIGTGGQTRTSAFISTTSNRGFAVRFSEQLLAEAPRVYLYEIVPNRSFYNMRISLEAKGGVDPSLAERALTQGEWVSTGRIPADHIKSATPLSRPATGGGAPVQGPPEPNENIRGTNRRGFNPNATAQANPHPYGKPATGTGATAGGLTRFATGPDLVGPQGERYLYRGDARAPKSGILTSGFSSRGFDVNDGTHLSGDMTRSAYISTSWSKERAGVYAGTDGWVYKIDKNKLGTVRNVYGASGLSGGHVDPAVARNMEVSVMYYIPPEAIVDAEPASFRSQTKSVGARVRHKYGVWQRDVAARHRPATASIRTGAKAASGGLLLAEKLFEIFPELRDVFAPLNAWLDEKWAGAQRAVQDVLFSSLRRAREAREAYDAIPKHRYATQRQEWERSLRKVPGNTHLYGHPLSARVEPGSEISAEDVGNINEALRYATARVWADENLEQIRQYFLRKLKEDETGARDGDTTSADVADVDAILKTITPEVIAEEYVDHGTMEFAEVYTLHAQRYLAEKEAAAGGLKVTIEVTVDSAEETQVLVPNAETSVGGVTWSLNGRAVSRFKKEAHHPSRHKHGLAAGHTVTLTSILDTSSAKGEALSLYHPLTQNQSLDIIPRKHGTDINYVFLLPVQPDGRLTGVEVQVEGDGRTKTLKSHKDVAFRPGVPLKVRVLYPGRDGSS